MSGTGWFGAVGLSIVTLGCATAGGAAQSSWDDSLWEIQAQEFRVETYKGRESLYMRDGTAWMKGVEFQDGVIEMDVAAPAIQGFHGIRFRAVTPFDHEHVYIRPHLSGKSDAVQYNPIYHGISSWQLYSEPRYALPVSIEADRWIHVRIAVQGSRMELSVDGELLVFPELVRDPESGAFGISSSGAAGRFANVVVRPDADPEFQGGEGAQAIVAEAGTVKVWRVSEAFEEAEIDGLTEATAGHPPRSDLGAALRRGPRHSQHRPTAEPARREQHCVRSRHSARGSGTHRPCPLGIQRPRPRFSERHATLRSG